MTFDDDTEWNDILRAKGIIPPKPTKEIEVTEDELIQLVEQTVAEKTGANHTLFNKPLDECDLDELKELEDEDDPLFNDDHVIEAYRRQRMAEMKAQLSREKYGRVYPISKPDYTREVTEASMNSHVVVCLYQEYLMECKLLNKILDRIAEKHPSVKFCRIIADLCIPHYPDKNVPTILVYDKGDLKKQIIGISEFTIKHLKNNNYDNDEDDEDDEEEQDNSSGSMSVSSVEHVFESIGVFSS